MNKKALTGLVLLSFLLVLSGLTGCANNAYFGVRNQAIGVPGEFAQTEAAIEKAERSPGAQYAPEKLAEARELGKKGVETYWGCRTKEGMALLAEARGLARQAAMAKAPPKPAPAPVAAAPAKPAPKPAPATKPPAVAAAPKPVAVPPAPKRVIVLKEVDFGFDSAELTPETKAVLDDQVALLREEPDARVEIGGHTDSIGAEEYNLDLSERRAKAVMEYLVSKGISPENLTALGYGEALPIAPNQTREGRAKNRRVELKHIPE